MSTSDNESASKGNYWQEFYSSQQTRQLPVPSQFAVFVAGELMQPHRIIDLGCGGGRDSMFFASRGHVVSGVDGSDAAIQNCRALASEKGLAGLEFSCAQIGDTDLPARLRRAEGLPVLVYARFFLHAITDEEEAHFFELSRRLTEGGGMMAVEFRTMRDMAQQKVTGAHYRRFIDPVMFNARALGAGFAPRYFVEGFGFAKYKDDDAHVARFICERTFSP